MKTLVVTQTVAYYDRTESLTEILTEVEEGEYESKHNEVKYERIQVFEDDKLIYDSEGEPVVTVFISRDGGEVEDLQALVDGEEPNVEWLGTDSNGEEVAVTLELSPVDPNEEE